MPPQTAPIYLTSEEAEVIKNALGNYNFDCGEKDAKIAEVFKRWQYWMDCNFPDHNKPRA